MHNMSITWYIYPLECVLHQPQLIQFHLWAKIVNSDRHFVKWPPQLPWEKYAMALCPKIFLVVCPNCVPNFMLLSPNPQFDQNSSHICCTISLSRNKIIWIFKRESIKKQFVVVDLYTHYKRIGHVIITKPHFSSRDGINSHCRRFDSLIFRCMTAVVAAPTGR